MEGGGPPALTIDVRDVASAFGDHEAQHQDIHVIESHQMLDFGQLVREGTCLIEIAVQQGDRRLVRQLLDIASLHVLGRLVVPPVHRLDVTHLSRAPPQLLATNAGEDLQTGDVAERDELVTARDPLGDVERPAAESECEQRSTECDRVAQGAGVVDRLPHHRGPRPRVVATLCDLPSQQGKDAHSPCGLRLWEHLECVLGECAERRVVIHDRGCTAGDRHDAADRLRQRRAVTAAASPSGLRRAACRAPDAHRSARVPHRGGS